MDKQIPQALSNLIPTWTEPLPAELIDLGGSLLAQSRSKANSLKADEEIARTYACANIACERLKQRLGLPKIQPNPPCPPRVYQKLYRYLDGALPAVSRKAGNASSSKSGQTVQATKSQAKHIRPDRAPQHRSSRLTTTSKSVSDAETPSWSMPTIRQLCRSLNAPAAPHHVFAGVSSILSSLAQSRRAPTVSVPGLIIVVFILVTTRLTGVETKPEDFLQLREHAMSEVRSALSDRSILVSCEVEDVDECMRQVGEYSWTDMDWFNNIDVGSGITAGDGNTSDDGPAVRGQEEENEEGHRILPLQMQTVDDLEEDDDGPGYLQPGLGTMMNESVDWLSDAKRRSYEGWKSNILQQIKELQAQQRDEMITEDG